ncbi:MAG: PKD domain-containing protein [Crocinitomicaceae bacterium]
MIRRSLFIFFACYLSSATASHIVGGEMFYDHISGNEYRVTVKLYRDCLSDGAEFDANLPVTIFDGNNIQLSQFTIPFPGSTELAVQFSNPCVTIPTDICVEEAIYEKVVTLPASNTGWTLSYQRCCRGPSVVNLVDAGNTGLTLTVSIPAQSAVPSNSSPRFKNFPPLLLCANDPLNFDHSAIDPDGDVLEYELCTPFAGGSALAPAPNPASPPPYTFVNWEAGSTQNDPFGNGSITIDQNTGQMIAAPAVQGLYAVGVCVKEFRNGVQIGVSRRDFLFRVMNCEIEMEAEITPQNQLSTFTSYCEGLTIDFENNSYGGTNYQWDFGVNSLTTDVSTDFEPSYTYPGPGQYEVTLVVNPGWSCTDTAISTFIVNHEIDAFFEPPATQCIVDNSYDFIGQGTFPSSGTTFEWEFGNEAIPQTSSDQSPTGVEFTDHGTHQVTFNVFYDQCEASYTAPVEVAAPPMVNFGVPDELKCVPYTAQFTNLSTASTPIFSVWDFGDGQTSTNTHPVHVYDQVGTYDVSLTIWTISGCIDTLTMLRTNLIEVFPRPTSQFSVSPTEINEYEANFYFIDQSSGAVEKWFHFADGTAEKADSIWHFYNDPGVYYPWQVVYNEYGCSDRSQQMIKITPNIPIMVPNAFTPNGDTYNNTFQPVLYEDQVYELFIYNRWGEQVHHSKALNANWDGTYNGVLVEDGVYIWKIIYTSFDPEEENILVEVQGHVTVIK